MKKEKRAKKEETGKNILILDRGIDAKDMAGPRTVCCRVAVFPFR